MCASFLLIFVFSRPETLLGDILNVCIETEPNFLRRRRHHRGVLVTNFLIVFLNLTELIYFISCSLKVVKADGPWHVGILRKSRAYPISGNSLYFPSTLVKRVLIGDTKKVIHSILTSQSNLPDLILTLWNATNLVATDSNGLSDPYCKVHEFKNTWDSHLYNSDSSRRWQHAKISNGTAFSADSMLYTLVYCTVQVVKDLNPVWNQAFNFSNFKLTDKIKIVFFDWDRFGSDDHLGRAEGDLFPAVLSLGESRTFSYPILKDGKAAGFVSVALQLTGAPANWLGEAQKMDEIARCAAAELERKASQLHPEAAFPVNLTPNSKVVEEATMESPSHEARALDKAEAKIEGAKAERIANAAAESPAILVHSDQISEQITCRSPSYPASI